MSDSIERVKLLANHFRDNHGNEMKGFGLMEPLTVKCETIGTFRVNLEGSAYRMYNQVSGLFSVISSDTQEIEQSPIADYCNALRQSRTER